MKLKLKLVLNIFGFGLQYESVTKNIIAINISKERNMFVAERFLSNVSKRVWSNIQFLTDGGTWYPPKHVKFFKLKHHLHSPFEKSIIEENDAIY